MRLRSIFTIAMSLTIGAMFLTLPAGAEEPVSAKAEVKQKALWDNVYLTRYRGELPKEDPSVDLRLLLERFFTVQSFTWDGDELPADRQDLVHPKIIHTYGAVGKVKWEADPNSKFSGLFKSGGIGLARLSLAGQSGAYTPGMGLKILVDGQPSVNFLIMYSVQGQGDDRNFFRNTFKNVIPPIEGNGIKELGLTIGAGRFFAALMLLDAKFRPDNERTLPLDEASTIASDGAAAQNVNNPFVVSFIPTPTVTAAFEKTIKQDMREGLATLKPGTVLYDIYARGKDEITSSRVGQLRLVDENFVASQYGDERLFFKHQVKVP
jgi:hypothetical protein